MEAALVDAAEILRAGGLVAFPTETVYGLGADATNAAAVAGVFEAKGRPATNPLIVHAYDSSMARQCVAHWPVRAAKLAERFWPGPLTIVLPKSELIPAIVSAGLETVGVRVPANLVARRLIERTGRPLAAPSANRSTGISPTRAAHVLKDLNGRIDLVIDGGATLVGIESTVVDVSGDRIRILRPGVVTAEQIGMAIGEEVEGAECVLGSDEERRSMASPGQMRVHYAPRTLTTRWDVTDVERFSKEGKTGLLVLGHRGFAPTWDVAMHIELNTAEMAQAGLFEALHRLDDALLDEIMIILPPEQPEWRAVRDRVLRASRLGLMRE